MTIPAVPAVPDPLSSTFAVDALAFTQWMAAAAPEFNAAAAAVNADSGDAQQAVTDSQAARDAAIAARDAASGYATSASASSTSAATAKSGAESARDAAAATYTNFDKRYLGEKATPPTVDNQGAALHVGALYFNTVQNSMRIWDGSQWNAAYLPAGAYQETLVSGTNIKTVNGQTILGSGNLSVIPDVLRSEKTSAYTLIATDKGKLIDCLGTFVLSFTAAATLGSGWWCYVRNIGSGSITADPNGTELIDGVATESIPAGSTVLVTCDGSAFNTVELKRRRYDRRQLITSTSTFTVPPDTYVLRGYAVGAGGNGAVSGNGGAGGGMAYGDFSVRPGDVINISIASGIAKVTKSGVDLLIGNPASGNTTAGTATKHSSVDNGGAYSGGTPGGGVRGGASSGSPLGTGKSGGNGGGAGWGSGLPSNGGSGIGGIGLGNDGGPGLSQSIPISEPLFLGLTSPGPSSGASVGGSGGPGSGGAYSPNNVGGSGGFGGGGGASGSSDGGIGGFGGGGGQAASGFTGGSGGFGGGGGSVNTSGTGGAGGPAAVIIIY